MMMKKFAIFLVLLGLAGGGVYYYKPALVEQEAPALLKQWFHKAQQQLAENKPAEKPAEKQKAAAPAENTYVPSGTPAVSGDRTPAPELDAVEVAPLLLDFPENKDARARAKEENRPCLVLWYGSDWMPEAQEIAEEWKKLEKKNLPLVIGQIDERVGTLRDLQERERLLPTGAFHNLPVAVLLAPDDTLLAIYTGRMVQNAAAMEKAVTRSLKRMPQYMELVDKARRTEGLEGALAAADALAMMPQNDAARNRQLKDILNRKDPEHKTLCRYLYCMDHMAMYGEINAVLNGGKGADAKFKGDQRKFDEGIAFVQKVLNAREINTEIKQQWTSGLAYVYREKFRAGKDAAVRAKVVETYRAVVEMDPESEYGKGAARWANYWDENTPYVFETPYYGSGDMTVDFEKDWHVNVSEQMDGPGDYTFTLVPCHDGHMTTKGYQLYANDRHVCDANEAADVSTKTVTFKVPRALKGRVEVRFKVRCFDGWYGCSGEMVMKKNAPAPESTAPEEESPAAQ